MTNEQLVARIRSGEDAADNMLQLWEQNQGFITKMAMKYFGRAEMEDLQQEGYIALCEAVRHYDADQGVPFISYAAFWIKQGMRRYIENCCGTVRIPTHAQQSVRQYKKMESEYRKCYGKEPSDREMSRFLCVSEEKFDQIKKAAQMGQIRSLSEPITNDDSDMSLSDLVASGEDMEENCIRRMDHDIMSRSLWTAVDTLPEEQAKTIRVRHCTSSTMNEVGEALAIPASRARTLYDNAMRSLRMPSKSQTYRRYFEQYLSAAPIHHVGLASFKTTWTSEVERAAIKGQIKKHHIM